VLGHVSRIQPVWRSQRIRAVLGGDFGPLHVAQTIPKKPPVEPETPSRFHSRLILTIANQRFAFDFFSRVTELNPAPAPRIFDIHSDFGKKRRNQPIRR
jgi:hypothetical protein